jgi:hypothetical protein
VRLAFMVPDTTAAGIQIDFCLHDEAQTNPGFEIGPVGRNLGLTGGLTYPMLTHYLTVTQGTYDVRTVSATATSCSQPLFGTQDVVPGFVLRSGEHLTAGAYGLAFHSGDSLRLGQSEDQTAPLTAGGTAYRFIHVAPNAGELTLNDTSSGTATEVFYGTYFGYAGVTDQFDPYMQATPGTFSFSITLVNSTTVFAQAANVTLAADTTYTVFAIGDGTNQPHQLLFCADDLIPAAVGSVSANCTAY